MADENLRPALYHRLSWLWPLLFRPLARKLWRWLGWGLVVVYFLFCALVLTLRYGVLPRVADYRPQLEQMASQAIGLPVKIGQVEAGWDGLNPRLELAQVAIHDRQGRPAFALDHVESVLSWRSVWRLQPTLSLLAIKGPELHIRRDEKGRITIAGVDAEGESDPRIAEWVLDQRHIVVSDARITWFDGLRKAPPLTLENLQFRLDNRGERHRFGLAATPPAQLASRFEVRGDLRGNWGESLDEVSGKLFLELDYADFSGWRTWLDYPVHLPQGRGALRAWGDWDEGHGRLTADVALEDLRIRLGRTVPELDLASMRGRLEGSYRGDAWAISGRKVELTTLDGIRVAPTDFQADWRQDDKAGRILGSASANLMDLESLQRLAAYLPLDARSRELLGAHQPRGRIADLRASWEVVREELVHYALRARFDKLGMLAGGYFPGAKGLSGEVEATDRGGSLTLDSREASLDLPAVFPESVIPLAEVKAKAVWKIDGKEVEARLDRMDFASPDAAGSARGNYHYTGDGPGEIDLTAALTRADGTAVWRYMPHAVNLDTRTWLRQSITQGKASDARLILKGDLRNFPFRDSRQGQFLITAKAHGARLDYAPGWPALTDVDADLSFGVGMRVEARKGVILGTAVTSAVAEIPDFEAEQEKLIVKGRVAGPTAEFLKFIDLSPVGKKIDNFTEDMRASGNGTLDLRLDMPLRHVLDTEVMGEYVFANNVVHVIPGLPPLSNVNGRLFLSEKSVTAPEITAQVLGGPMKLSVKNDGERVNVVMSGSASAKEARRQFDWPVLDYVTGTTAWKGEVKVRKKSADFTVDSNLLGISSSLPEPFNKAATVAFPLHFEKSGSTQVAKDGVVRDQLRFSLGKVVEGVVQRYEDGDTMRIERGAVAVGEALPRTPDRGVAVAVSLARLDGDFWRQALTRSGDAAPASGSVASSGPPFGIREVVLKTPALRLFNRDYTNLRLSLAPRDEGWQIGLSTKEAEGDIRWQGKEGGRIDADFRRLAVPAAATVAGSEEAILNSLPGMDIHVADFSLGDKRLGDLRVKAHNDKGVWQLDSLNLANPDGELKGKGQWSSAGGHRTRLNFELAVANTSKFLDRMGYPGAIKRGGTANLKGDLGWEGPLTTIDYGTLSGDMTVAVGKGQFAKLEPGLGKLLGILSLQSLPRRLSLDFRDIFSEGFAFDSIEGKLAVKNGVMRTNNDLTIDGPAARVVMKGETDLRRETQNLVVTVQPEMGGVVSVGALVLAHPVVGAAATVINKVLQNPLNKIFSFQYKVTGTWDDPKVEKVGQSVQEVPGTTALSPTASVPTPAKSEEEHQP